MAFDMPDIRAYDQLVTEAYKIGTGENTAQDFLSFYSSMFKHQSCTLIGYDDLRPARDVFAFTNFSGDALVEYTQYYSTVHPYADQLLKVPPYVIGHGKLHMSDEELFKTEYYNDFIKPNGDASQTFGVPIFKEADRFLMWSNNYAPQYYAEAKAAMRAMAMLVPHIRRSFELARRMDVQTQANRTLEQALDHTSNPVYICDGDMGIQFSNTAGEGLLLDQGPVTSRKNLLFFRAADVNIAVARRVRDFADDDFSRQSLSNALFVRVAMAPSSHQFAFVTPLPDQANAQRSLFGTMAKRPVMIMLVDPDRELSAREDIVQIVFGVSPAEASLACALAAGMTPGEFAEERQVSKNTVRVQTQSLMNKMGARRQSDVTRMLASAFAGLNFE